MRRFTKKQYLVAGVAAAIIAGTAGTALAYWTAAGSGSGSGTTGTSSAVTITQTSTVANMGPGVAAQTLSGTFTVANPTRVEQVTAAVVTNGTCTAADFTIVQPTATAATVSTGSTWGGGSIVFKDDPARNQDACKGITMAIAYSSN